MRDALDTLMPHLLVQFRIDPNIFSAHMFLSESNDRFDGPWSTLLERATMDVFVQVDGVLPGYNVLESATGFGGLYYQGSGLDAGFKFFQSRLPESNLLLILGGGGLQSNQAVSQAFWG